MKILIHNYSDELQMAEAALRMLVIWIVRQLNLNVTSADIILTDDDSLQKLHKEYLDDDSFTDVMTFNLADSDSIEAEIYVSKDRVKQHASRFKTTISKEMVRVIVHAFLHLAGFNDQTGKERKIMKSKEEHYLSQAEGIFTGH